MRKYSFIAILGVAAVSFFMSSCSVLHTTCPTAPVNYPAFVSELDIDTQHPVTATAKAVRLGFLTFGPKKFAEFSPKSIVGADRVKSAALYNAIEGTDYDVVVGPEYETMIKRYLIVAVYKTRLTGFGGKVVGIHKLAADEVAPGLNSFSEEFKVTRTVSDAPAGETAAPTEPDSSSSKDATKSKGTVSKAANAVKETAGKAASSVKKTAAKAKDSVESKASEAKAKKAEKAAQKATESKAATEAQSVDTGTADAATNSQIKTLYNHAVKCVRSGDTDGAIKDYEKALSIVKSIGTLSKDDESVMSQWEAYMKPILSSKKRK